MRHLSSTVGAGIACVLVGLGPRTVALAADGKVPGGLTAGDWAGIRDAYEARRHAVLAVDGGHEAPSPGQAWTTHFDGRGLTTTPDEGGWIWGLELLGYGWGGAEREVRSPRGVSTDGGRLVYEWDERLSEWYVNDPRGLEHGYTLDTRPADVKGPLAVTLAIRGDLLAEIGTNGRDLRFVDATGAAALTYSGLAVFDADGRPLAARWKRLGSDLHLSIDDENARYPVTIDPIAQRAYLKASNTDAGDVFGESLAVSGDTVIVGARAEDSGATGINADQSSNDAPDSGAAYVFVRDGTTWTQQAYLKPFNTDAGDFFGGSVALSGDTTVIAARLEDSGATGVNADQSDNSAIESGAVYVFVRDGTTWTQQAYLKASNTDAHDQFGGSVAVSGDTVIVGAHAEDSGATGVNADQGDNSAFNSGAAYVFVRDGTSWVQQAYLKASNTDGGDFFGLTVALSGDTAIVGAYGESSGATGVNGDESDNTAVRSGAAYVFVRSGTTWTQQAYLKASNTEGHDLFGSSVAISGDTAIVGAYGEDSGATGANADQSDNSAGDAGAAYVFVRSGTTWSQQAYLKASNTDAHDQFGRPVALSYEAVIVGASGEDSGATGVNADPSDNSAASSGAAYVFVRDGTTWTQQAYLKASNTDDLDLFGRAVAISGDMSVVGAPQEDSHATGVDGDGSDNAAPTSGAAYVFDLDAPDPPTPFCFGDGSGTACPCGNLGATGHGCAHSAGPGGRLGASGSTSIGAGSLVLEGTDLVPSSFGLYFQGTSALSGAPFGDGLRCAGGSIVRLQVRPTNAAGASSTTVDIAARGGVVAGETRYYQLWFRDTAGSPCGSGFNLTSGLRVTWGP